MTFVHIPMCRVSSSIVETYLANDKITAILDRASRESDEALTCQRWLRNAPPKRAIMTALYGDLLQETERLKVLDVGGGITAISRLLSSYHRYELADLLAHDSAEMVGEFLRTVPELVLHRGDWHQVKFGGDYDLVIANDLFPNVDQRLELFIEAMLPRCRQLRMSLTFYNNNRFYITRRVDGEEVFCMLAWNGFLTQTTLQRFADRAIEPDWSLFHAQSDSVYANGRQVCLLSLRGDLENKS